MGYRDNPINRPVGVRILRDIYDLIYLKNPGSRRNSSNRLATENTQMSEIVSNFKYNAPRIVMMMRRFLTGNTHVQTSNAGDSGIFVCNPVAFGEAGRTGGGASGPDASKTRGCGRRDFLWWWEFTDFGLYNNPANWGSSVGLERWQRNLHDPTYRGKRFQVVVGRVKCNQVKTCDPENGGCGTTWRGSGRCPSPYCNSSTPKSVGGCGTESYAIFKVNTNHPLRDYWTTGQRHRDSNTETTSQFVNGAPIRGANSEMPPNMVGIINNSKFVEDSASSQAFYRIYYQGLPPENTYLTTQAECLKYIPYLQLGYTSTKDRNNSRPNAYVCNSCGIERFAPVNENFETNFDIYPRKTYFSQSQYQGDQHGGLCKNIGDVQRSYAGLDGTFGCLCGGVFEPMLKIKALSDEQLTIYNRIQAAQEEGMARTTRQLGRTGGFRGMESGSGRSSDYATYARGAVQDDAIRAVYAEFGTVAVRDATAAHEAIKQLQTLRQKNAFPASFALSMCRYAFVRSVMAVCKNPDHKNVGWQYPGSNAREVTNYQPLIDGRGQAMDYCPTCGVNGDAKFIEPHPQNFIMPPMPYTIMNRQPLTAEDSVGILPNGAMIAQAFADRPQWSLVLKSQVDSQERYNLRLELPQVYMGDVIPTEFTPQPPQPVSDRNIEGFTCPNERQGPLTYEAEWIINNSTTAAPVPSAASLNENQTLITAEYNEGDTTLVVSNPEKIAVGDYLNADGIPVGTQAVAITGGAITISNPIVRAAGNLDAATGRPTQITIFTAPRVAEIVKNPLTAVGAEGSMSCCAGAPNNYTFAVTEGKSAEAYFSLIQGRWIDISPMVTDQRGNKTPRWTQFPDVTGVLESGSVNWSGPGLTGVPMNDSLQYMMDNNIPSNYAIQSETGYDYCHINDREIPANQLVQDWTGRANGGLAAILSARAPGGNSAIIQGSHRIQLMETSEVPQQGIAVRYYLCRECEAISQVGQAAAGRGEASTLLEALQTGRYYPGYAAIQHYINTGQLQSLDNLISPAGDLQLLPSRTSGLSQGYFEGAVAWETEPGTDSVAEEGGRTREVTIPAGWWKWALRFRAELVEGGDYRY